LESLREECVAPMIFFGETAPQPAHEAAAFVRTLAEAVHAAHSCGIVHRDVKPTNILLGAEGTPKISDFRLARQLGDGTGLSHTGVPLGTPSYMAPEQARGRPDVTNSQFE
jgi:serine/threonine protein kinase